MDKNSLANNIEKRYGAFLNVNEVAEYMSIHRNTARQRLVGIPYVENGKEKKYFYKDVAEMIAERKRV